MSVVCTSYVCRMHVVCLSYARRMPVVCASSARRLLVVCLSSVRRMPVVWLLSSCVIYHSGFVGIEFSGVDGTFLKHIHLRTACLLILVTRDGNNNLVIIAWCYCLGETSNNYEYFANHLRTMSHAKEYMDRPTHLLYSDRMKGIKHFEKNFNCGHANCIVHICKNVIRHCAQFYGAKTNIPADPIHKIQQSASKAECETRLREFEKYFPHAGAYLRKLTPKKVFKYTIVEAGYSTHGHRTSNLVEIINNVVKYARNLDCYR